MTGKTLFLAGTALIAAVTFAGPAGAAAAASKPAPPTAADYQALEQRVETLETQLQQKSDQQSSDRTRLSTLEQQFNYASWTYDNGRPTISSGDGRFSLALRTRFQVDVASFMQSGSLPASVTAGRDLANGVDVRRAYFGIEGKVFRDFWYELRYNFGGSGSEASFGNGLGDQPLNLARVAYLGIPHFRINAGIIQPVFTYGNSVSSAELTFMEFPSAVAAAIGSYGGDDSRRGIEFDYQNTDVFRGGDNLVIVGAWTGQKTGTTRTNDEGDQILGRIAYRLWSDGPSNIQIGASGSKIMKVAGAAIPGGIAADPMVLNLADRPEVRVDGTSLINTSLTGAACGMPNAATSCSAATGGWLYGFEGGANINNFYISGEYYKYHVDRDFNYFNTHTSLTGAQKTALKAAGDPEYSGWYAEASWVITGEPKTYSPSNMANNYGVWGAPRVVKPFSLDGNSWGAWEVAMRYSILDLNWNSGTAGSAVPLGGIRGGDQKIWTFGLNWYLNNNVRTTVDYLVVDVNKLNAAGKQAGQKFGVLAARLQFAL